jgi:hypothetical protein
MTVLQTSKLLQFDLEDALTSSAELCRDWAVRSADVAVQYLHLTIFKRYQEEIDNRDRRIFE